MSIILVLILALLLPPCHLSLSPSQPPLITPSTVASHLWSTSYLYNTEIHGVLCRRPELGPPRYRLAYMPIRNRGEIIRLVLEEAGIPYEVEVVGYKNWESGVKASTPHGKCPALRDYDGRGNDLCQEQSIIRFLAAELGLDGSCPVERAAVDSMHALWFSTMRNSGVSHSGEHYSVEALKASDCREDLEVPPYEEIFRRNELTVAQRR